MISRAGAFSFPCETEASYLVRLFNYSAFQMELSHCTRLSSFPLVQARSGLSLCCVCLTMDAAVYFTSLDENIPLQSRSWFWKKRNAVSPAAENISKLGIWEKTAIPSYSQATANFMRGEVDPNSPIVSSADLPGSVSDLDETEAQQSCVIKSIAIDEESIKTSVPQEESWLSKLASHKNKLSYIKRCIGLGENSTSTEKELQNTTNDGSDDNRRSLEANEYLTKEGQPYIPYKLAKLYITKIVEDMQQMKLKHMKIIKELELIRREDQEQAIMAVRSHYESEMKILKSKMKETKEQVDKKNSYWEDMIKSLREENRDLIKDKADLLCQVKEMNETWEKEKISILESHSEKIALLYSYQTSTLEELQMARMDLEKVLAILNSQMTVPRSQQMNSVASGNTNYNTEAGMKWENRNIELTDGTEKQEILMQNTDLVKAHDTLEKIIKSMHKREKDMSEFLLCKSVFNRGIKPQITITTLLKTVLSKIHFIYCEVPEVQQFVSHLLKKNDAEIADRKKAFNKTQADIFSYEATAENKPLDYESEWVAVKLCRSLANAKSDLEYAEYEKIAIDCITSGKIPEWIFRNNLNTSMTESDFCTENDQRMRIPDEVDDTYKPETQQKIHSSNPLTIRVSDQNDTGRWNQQSFDPWIFSKPLFC
ncbi:uncharacterized protein LOC115096948 [Rhinatrema bivittatum]|uniref:uncharacterized protein LOC115096948 n=1 Tax=Rhinatrema bivittatum TaxID=194408 RepID=UPI00112A6884|nr:uncharacterized protein LOC115096948 [Rhinatrema bivittatum]